MRFTLVLLFLLARIIAPFTSAQDAASSTCIVRPLGHGKDDTSQVEAAIAKCGHFGTTIFEQGEFNITRKMTWNLKSARVDMHGFLSFKPDIQYWLNANNTYRVIFLQSQASWFVITGTDFVVDGNNAGGINGNGQPWWSYFANRTREDGDGRPISLTLSNVTRGTVTNFRVQSPPFWCNALAQSRDVVYDGIMCNATNADPAWVGQNIVPNTDGIDTYRSDNVSLLNWDVTCGDDCLSIRGNSTNVAVNNITCHGGNGIAVGSLGQYIGLNDYVENVDMNNLFLRRIDASIQPNMVNGVYFKSWSGTVNGVPPVGGGGAGGLVRNFTARNVVLDGVSRPIHLYQTNGGKTGDAPSQLMFGNLMFTNWSGTAVANPIVNFACSAAVGCANISFANFSIAPPPGQPASFICQNTINLAGLPGA